MQWNIAIYGSTSDCHLLYITHIPIQVEVSAKRVFSAISILYVGPMLLALFLIHELAFQLGSSFAQPLHKSYIVLIQEFDLLDQLSLYKRGRLSKTLEVL